MRFVFGKTTDDVKIVLNDGRDVTSEFHLTRVSMDLLPNEFTRIRLECEVDSIEIITPHVELVVPDTKADPA